MSFRNSIIEQSFFLLVLKGAISLEEAKEILQLYDGDKEGLLLLLNDIIDSVESYKMLAEGAKEAGEGQKPFLEQKILLVKEA